MRLLERLVRLPEPKTSLGHESRYYLMSSSEKLGKGRPGTRVHDAIKHVPTTEAKEDYDGPKVLLSFACYCN